MKQGHAISLEGSHTRLVYMKVFFVKVRMFTNGGISTSIHVVHKSSSNAGSCSVNSATLLDLGSEESSSVSKPSSTVNTMRCTSEEARSVEKQKMCLSLGFQGNTIEKSMRMQRVT